MAWRRRSVLLAVAATMAWASVFEIVFTATGTVLHGWSVSYLVWLTLALGGWIALAVYLHVSPDWRLALAAAAVAIFWVSTGFATNSPSVHGEAGFTSSFSWSAEIFNELSKTLLGAAYLVGALRAR